MEGESDTEPYEEAPRWSPASQLPDFAIRRSATIIKVDEPKPLQVVNADELALLQLDYAQNKKKAERESERDDHLYRQRNCMVCGKLFWPTHSQQTMCSDECRKKHHAEVTLEAYHRKQAEKRNGGHLYPERVCEVCGKKFWPEGPATKICSEDCRLEKKRRESKTYYTRKRETAEPVRQTA